MRKTLLTFKHPLCHFLLNAVTASIKYTLFSHAGQVSPVVVVLILGVPPGVLETFLEGVQVGREGVEGGLICRSVVDGAISGWDSVTVDGSVVGFGTVDIGASSAFAFPDDRFTAAMLPLIVPIPPTPGSLRDPGGTGKGLPAPNPLGLGLTTGGAPTFFPVLVPLSIIVEPDDETAD